MKTYDITNKNVEYYVDCIVLPLNATQEDINDALDNAEMDITITWDDYSDVAPWETLHFDYNSPHSSEEGETSLTGYVDLREFCKHCNVSLRYTDAWGIVQDKIPLIIRSVVMKDEEDE